MALEFAADGWKTDKCYPYAVTDITGDLAPAKHILDTKLTVLAIVDDLCAGAPIGEISAAFHNTLAEMIVDLARRVGQTNVVLTGGCFQNKTLLERAVDRLTVEGFCPYWHRTIPPNDGGIALGQVIGAIREQDDMCLAVPGQIISTNGDEESLERTGRVSFGGVIKEVNLAYVPEAQIGDFVIVHVGFALSVVDALEASRVFEYLEEMGELGELQDE